jgi:hypothetical protein
MLLAHGADDVGEHSPNALQNSKWLSLAAVRRTLGSRGQDSGSCASFRCQMSRAG